MKPGQECCANTIINPDKEYCCDQAKANAQNGADSQGKLI